MWIDLCVLMVPTFGGSTGIASHLSRSVRSGTATGVTVWSELVLSAVSCEIVVRPSSCWS